MSHVPGGLVYKRFLNALRPVDGAPPPAVCANGAVWSAIVPPTQLPGANGLFPLARGATRFVRVGRSVSTPGTFEYQYSSDNGLSWIDGADVITPNFDQPTSRANNLVYGNGRFFQRVSNFQFMRSVDEGLTFQTVNTASGSFPNMRECAAFLGGQFFMFNNTQLTRSVDVSNNASFSEPVINGLVGNIAGMYEWEGDIYLTTGPTSPVPGTGRLYVSTDGGATFNWTGVFQPWGQQSEAPFRIAAGLNSRCGIGFNTTGTGFFTNDGQTWFASAGTAGTNRIEVAYQQGVYMMFSPSNEFPLISLDEGATFTASPNSMTSSSGAYCVAVDGVNVTVGTMSDTSAPYKRGVC